MKKFFLLSVLFIFMFLISGCVTVNTDGCCSDKKTVKADSTEDSNPIKKADDWVKKNLW